MSDSIKVKNSIKTERYEIPKKDSGKSWNRNKFKLESIKEDAAKEKERTDPGLDIDSITL